MYTIHIVKDKDRIPMGADSNGFLKTSETGGYQYIYANHKNMINIRVSEYLRSDGARKPDRWTSDIEVGALTIIEMVNSLSGEPANSTGDYICINISKLTNCPAIFVGLNELYVEPDMTEEYLVAKIEELYDAGV